MEPTAPDASNINPVEKKISTASNYYESVDDVPRKSPGYQVTIYLKIKNITTVTVKEFLYAVAPTSNAQLFSKMKEGASRYLALIEKGVSFVLNRMASNRKYLSLSFTFLSPLVCLNFTTFFVQQLENRYFR